MRISKPGKGEGGGGDERRRSRERTREARRRRKEIERRAVEAAAPAQKAEPKVKAKPNRQSKAESKTATKQKVKAKQKAKSKVAFHKKVTSAAGEAGRRLALPKLAAAAGRSAALLLRLLGKVAFIFFWLLARVERVGRRLVAAAAGPISSLVAGLGRQLTPTRVAVTITGAAVLSALASQAIDYRAVAIGEAAYVDVAQIAQAPLTGHETPWTAHGPLVGLAALVAAAGAVLALRGGGRRPTLIALGAAGFALLVILAIDLPRAGDVGNAADEYAGTGTVLLAGFYIELSAILLIALTASLPTLWRLQIAWPGSKSPARPSRLSRQPRSRQVDLRREKKRTA